MIIVPLRFVLLAAESCANKPHESLPFIANVIVPQAVRPREGGAAQHGWRRLSDVTGDDGQSQSGAGRRPGAGGRELIGGPGVTRIPVFSSHGIPPSRRTVSSHTDPPARLEKKKKKKRTTTPQSERPTADSFSSRLSPLGLFIEHASGRRPVQKELFVAALWDPPWPHYHHPTNHPSNLTGMRCLSGGGKKQKTKKKRTLGDLFHRRWRGHRQRKDGWTRGRGEGVGGQQKRREANKANHVPFWKVAASYTAKKEDIFFLFFCVFVNKPTPPAPPPLHPSLPSSCSRLETIAGSSQVVAPFSFTQEVVSEIRVTACMLLL